MAYLSLLQVQQFLTPYQVVLLMLGREVGREEGREVGRQVGREEASQEEEECGICLALAVHLLCSLMFSPPVASCLPLLNPLFHYQNGVTVEGGGYVCVCVRGGGLETASSDPVGCC